MAIAANRLLQPMLFGGSATDPAVLVGAAAAAAVATIGATIAPARTATRIDPMIVMRNE